MKRQRDTTQHERQTKNNMKIIIDEMSKQNVCRNEDASNLHHVLAEAEKNKVFLN